MVLSFVLPKENTTKKSAGRYWKSCLRIYARVAKNPRPTQNLLRRIFTRPAHVMRDGAFPARPTRLHEYEEHKQHTTIAL